MRSESSTSQLFLYIDLQSLDIEELSGLEFQQLMQDKQSVEELGVVLQKLARKDFPESGAKEFDRMLKGRFYQALLPKWQCKLGTPKTDESFEDLYARARAIERHAQQIGAGRQVNSMRSEPSTADEPSKKTDTASEPRTSKSWHGQPRRDDRNKSRGCFHCGEVGHIQHNCPKLATEAAGRSRGKVSSMVAQDASKHLEHCSIEELEKVLAEKKAGVEQLQLSGTATVDVVTGNTVRAKGSLLRACVEIEGLPVEAVVDTRAQCTVISRELLRNLGRHMRERKMELPKCAPPSVKLVGRGGKGGDELAITAKVPFHFALDGYSTYAPVFVQPDSDIQCLLGMNVIPSLGIWVKRANGEVMTEPTAPEPSAETKVYLIQSTRIQGRMALFKKLRLTYL